MIRIKPEPKRVTAKRNAVTADRNAQEATVTLNRNAARQKAWRDRRKAISQLNALAGVDDNGGILPPTSEQLAVRITPPAWWENRAAKVDIWADFHETVSADG